MECNNLSKEMLSLHVPDEKPSLKATTNAQYNIPVHSQEEMSERSNYYNNQDDVNFSYNTEAKLREKSIPFVGSDEFCSCSDCSHSRSYRTQSWATKSRETPVTAAELSQPQNHYTNYSGNVTHVIMINDTGHIHMSTNHITNISTNINPKGKVSSKKYRQSQPTSGHFYPKRGPILRKIVITSSQKLLDGRNLDMLCKNLGHHWKQVAEHLGFLSEEINTIEQTYGSEGLYETTWQFLQCWREKVGHKATFCAMADALIDIRKHDIAVQLKVS